MVHVAMEMKKNKITLPLLIGGATTSKLHTALKIEPQYDFPVVHVLDASRAVSVVSNLLTDNTEVRNQFLSNLKEDYERVRIQRQQRQKFKELLSLTEAQANKFKIDWDHTYFNPPKQTGIRVFESVDTELLKSFIDWTPFFQTW